MRTIIHLYQSCNINDRPLDLHIDEMNRLYKETIYNYRYFRKTTLATRTTFQDNGIEKLDLSGNNEASTIQKRIRNLEANRAQHR